MGERPAEDPDVEAKRPDVGADRVMIDEDQPVTLEQVIDDDDSSDK